MSTLYIALNADMFLFHRLTLHPIRVKLIVYIKFNSSEVTLRNQTACIKDYLYGITKL